MALRKTERAGAVLGDLLERLPFRERLREYALWTVWKEVVGDLIASKAEPDSIKDGRLVVRVSNSTWMQEIQFLSDEIRTKLNERMGVPVVRELFLVLGRKKRRAKKAERSPTHPVDEAAIAALVPPIDKPELEAAIRRLARARARRLGPDA